ncbi:MAG: glycosyltransferase family 2 protein [Candidatus Magasanikbacteria bacterium]|nr:glycosyltransferase family 2 protein [Candidatus Magasanikbacteria bacterium]
MQKYPKVAIIYLSFHSEPYIDDVVSGLKMLTYPKDKVEFVVVDNPHSEYGPSVRVLEENVMPLSGKEIPHTTILPQSKNLGFSDGNNVGIKWAIENGFDYVFFHNNDGFVSGDFLEPLVRAMESDKKIGAAQSLMLLHPETGLVNSAGNEFHYLGFGFCGDYKKDVKEISNSIKKISYASGAALLMRVDLLKKYGLWDGDFFMYHEDLEYSLRLRSVGFDIVLVPNSIFYHKYQFSRSIEKFYWMERNRYGVMLMFFKWDTLMLLLPIALFLEFGLWFSAFKGGWIKERVRVYKYWLNTRNWQLWLGKRKNIQKIRRVSDKKLLENVATGIYFQEKSMENPLLKYIANPMMTLYYWIIVRRLVK